MKTLNKNSILITICAMLMLCCFTLVGCGETPTSDHDKYLSEGFTAVCSVEYKYDRYNDFPYSETLHSIYQYQYESTEITKEEYDSSDLEYRYLEKESNMNAEKNPYYFNQYSGIKYKTSINTTSDPNETKYYIRELKSYTENFVYVKVHDDDSLEIIDTDNSHIRITPSFYKIEYFK